MDIRPFRGWRYGASDGDVSRFVAPPYDILSAAQRQALLDGCERNVVAIDLPHFPPRQAGPDHLYAEAAGRLAQWQREGVLVQEDAPAIYVYEQTYTWADRTYTRRAMLCGVRATPLGEDVIPHEHTFAGPKADRLKLTEHTRTQLSPIFGFYDDEDGSVDAELARARDAGGPVLHAQVGPVGEALWAVTDQAMIAAITGMVRPRPVYIADGHHRYTTALNYRDRLLAAGEIDEQHEANYVMFALVSRANPGLLVLPTHRVIAGLSEAFSLRALVGRLEGMSLTQVDSDAHDWRDADAALRPFGQHAMALLGADGRETVVARLTDARAMQQAAPDAPQAWRELDVAILHELILDRAMEPWKTDAYGVEYTALGEEAVAMVRSGAGQLAVFLQGTPLAQVEAVADTGASMPHKSTYFYPKLTTGIVLKPLE